MLFTLCYIKFIDECQNQYTAISVKKWKKRSIIMYADDISSIGESSRPPFCLFLFFNFCLFIITLRLRVIFGGIFFWRKKIFTRNFFFRKFFSEKTLTLKKILTLKFFSTLTLIMLLTLTLKIIKHNFKVCLVQHNFLWVYKVYFSIMVPFFWRIGIQMVCLLHWKIL